MPAKGSGEPPAVRFWRRVDKAGPDECWIYTGSTAPNGYGLFWTAEGTVLAHRFAYEVQVGPIPDGLTIDHVKARGCQHKKCVNGAHLEPVTARVNTLRSTGPCALNAAKTHCKRGHPFDEGNTYVQPGGGRNCRTCKLDNERASADARNARRNARRASAREERRAA